MVSKVKEPAGSVVRWKNPPASRPSTLGFDSHAIAAALRSCPGVWALVLERGNSSYVGQITKGRSGTAFRPAGTFEATSRWDNGVCNIYARYVGERGEYR